jgi:signal peptidase I
MTNIDSAAPNKGKIRAYASEAMKTLLLSVGICILTKGTIAEARYIPSSSMEPTLKINDRILVEKISQPVLGRSVKRGDIMVFYPPTIETGIPDNGLLGRFIPLLPENPPAFIKRVIGLPGDRISIKKGVGVFVNGRLLNEPNDSKSPQYNLSKMSDIAGYSMTGKFIRPYANNNSPIIVPAHHWFMLGDNRNNSADSHVWGFVKQDRAVGRAFVTIWKDEWLKSLI